jgi:hypothetical protein
VKNWFQSLLSKWVNLCRYATERAVWMHLSDKRTELYREVRRMYHGKWSVGQ